MGDRTQKERERKINWKDLPYTTCHSILYSLAGAATLHVIDCGATGKQLLPHLSSSITALRCSNALCASIHLTAAHLTSWEFVSHWQVEISLLFLTDAFPALFLRFPLLSSLQRNAFIFYFCVSAERENIKVERNLKIKIRNITRTSLAHLVLMFRVTGIITSKSHEKCKAMNRCVATCRHNLTLFPN